MTAPRLDRTVAGRAAPPVRIVHLGLGGFHRAHQAEFTDRAGDAEEWGIAAFTGRRPDAAATLTAQDGLFTLVTRGAATDEARIVAGIAEALDGADTAGLVRRIADPRTAVVTLTVTEAAYGFGADGRISTAAPAVARDLATLREGRGGEFPRSIDTPLVRVLAGLDARRRADAGPLAVIPCDNLASGGPLVRAALLTLAAEVDGALVDHVMTSVDVVSTTVDRITPRLREEDLVTARALTGFADAAPVVAEPYTSWVLSGSFPAGCPDWASAGVEFTDDIRPFESRKLWMLNAAHSLMAYAGLVRGHATVADAAADDRIAAWIEELWADAARELGSAFDAAGLDRFRADLRARFANRRMADDLRRISADGVEKLRVRAVPIVLAGRARGEDAVGAARVMASWIVAVRVAGIPLDASIDRSTRALLALVHPALGDDDHVVALVDHLAGEIPARSTPTITTPDGGHLAHR